MGIVLNNHKMKTFWFLLFFGIEAASEDGFSQVDFFDPSMTEDNLRFIPKEPTVAETIGEDYNWRNGQTNPVVEGLDELMLELNRLASQYEPTPLDYIHKCTKIVKYESNGSGNLVRKETEECVDIPINSNYN